jgi:hypothetical protein
MWKPEHRLAAERSGLHYPSDLTDAEWAIVQPMIPPALDLLARVVARRIEPRRLFKHPSRSASR